GWRHRGVRLRRPPADRDRAVGRERRGRDRHERDRAGRADGRRAGRREPRPVPAADRPDPDVRAPAVRRIDFGPAGGAVASDNDPANPNYLPFGTQAYVSKSVNALGWVGPAPQLFDRGSGFSALQRDGVSNSASAPGDFQLDLLNASSSYFVTVLLGDPISTVHDGLFIQLIDPTGGTVNSTVASGLTVPAGLTTSLTFPATTD